LFQKLIVVLFIAVLAVPTGGLAAEIRVTSGDGSLSTVLVLGPIEAGDSQKFGALTQGLSRALVVFGSPGGLLTEGLAIGEQLRQAGFASAVAENTLCASACALAWLGGRPRLMRDSSRIGFHAAYTEHGTDKRESGVGNAIIGAYLTNMGLGLDAIRYMTTPGPDEVQWLSTRDALRIGIDVYSYEETVLGQRASGPALSAESGNYEIAQRAVANFYTRFKSAGMAGMSHSVADCYKRAAALRTVRSVQYCFTIDLLAVDLSAWGEKTYHFPILPYFTPSQANNRTHDLLISLRIRSDLGKLLNQWQDYMLLANLASVATHQE
jgi:hypothetical protein